MPRFWTATLVLGAMCTPADREPEPAAREALPAAGLVACLAGNPQARFALAAGLREISGLAATSDGRLLAHNDERGEIAELDPESGRIVKAFALGPEPVRADFEGIAVAGESVFLVTSDGRIVETREGKAGETVPFTVSESGVGDACEIEGLAFEPADQALLLLCKTPLEKKLQGTLTVFRWSVAEKRLLPDRISIELSKAFKEMYGRDFRGSGLERDPSTGNYLAISALNGLAVEFTREGVLASEGRLSRWHGQPEALAILPDGRVAVGDEGGKGAGMLAIYGCSR